MQARDESSSRAGKKRAGKQISYCSLSFWRLVQPERPGSPGRLRNYALRLAAAGFSFHREFLSRCELFFSGAGLELLLGVRNLLLALEILYAGE